MFDRKPLPVHLSRIHLWQPKGAEVRAKRCLLCSQCDNNVYMLSTHHKVEEFVTHRVHQGYKNGSWRET